MTFIKGSCQSKIIKKVIIKKDQKIMPPEINSVKAILPVQIWILVIKREVINHWLEVTMQSPPIHHSLHTFSLRKRDQQHISLTFPVKNDSSTPDTNSMTIKLPPSQHSRR